LSAIIVVPSPDRKEKREGERRERARPSAERRVKEVERNLSPDNPFGKIIIIVKRRGRGRKRVRHLLPLFWGVFLPFP